MKSVLGFVVLLSLCFPMGARASQPPPFTNLDEVKNSLNFFSAYAKDPIHIPRVAIFDRGFDGYQYELGRTLPVNTVYHPGPLAPLPGSGTPHGLVMAQLITALMTNGGSATQFTPELHLYNVFGYTNFKAAVDSAIAQKIDVILHSEVWEYGSNNDGRGFFNHDVSRAAQAGIIWVNASGNFGLTTFNSQITTDADHWVNLPDQNQSLELDCASEKNPTGGCHLRLVLSWNSFSDDVNTGTDKDLDLFLVDDQFNKVASSELRQTSGSQSEKDGFSKYPREIITQDLKPGKYFIRVKMISTNFSSTDTLRISANGDFLTLSHHDSDENLNNPADNPDVVSVGASDSDRSSISVSLKKPELVTMSAVKTGPGQEYLGSSNAAAFVAAGFGLLKSFWPELTRDQLLNVTSNPQGSLAVGLPENQLGFAGLGENRCFKPAQASTAPYLQGAIDLGGTVVQTTQGFKILTPVDPIVLTNGQSRRFINDMVVATTTGFQVYPRQYANQLPEGDVEVFEKPLDGKLCDTDDQLQLNLGTPGMAQTFKLPSFN